MGWTIGTYLKNRSFSPKLNFIAIAGIIAVCGFVFRTVASRLEAGKVMIVPPVSFKTFPVKIGDWVGEDVPLNGVIAEVTGNDDFCNRSYKDAINNNWVNLYIAYSARPRTMLGHRPDVCYIGAGWIHDSTEVSDFTSKSGRKISCLIHRFHLPHPNTREIVVLNFYVINGKTIAQESGFSGISWRTPNVKGDVANYVAQVQISSALENVVRDAAADMADQIVGFLPRSTAVNSDR